MLTQKQLDFFAQNGFVKGSKVLTDEQVEILRAETLRVIDDHQNSIRRERVPVRVANLTGNPENPVWQIVNIWEGSEAFEKLVVHNSMIVEEIAQLMKLECDAREIRLFHDQIQYKPAQKGGVNMWHQDSPYWPILEPKDVQLTAWVALDDVDPDNGCMSMVPGSHRWGDRISFLHTLADFRSMPECLDGHQVEVVTCPVEKGAVHFHHPLTWHGSPENRSGRPRRAIALHFMTERAVFNASGVHPMKPFVEGQPNEKVYGTHFPLVWKSQ
jgi:ectoine hydroxylase-related dioxygenase (phytanoyl-CoA dioxygenase family)